MPTLTLHVTPPPTADCARELAAALTRLTASILGKRSEVTVVCVHPMRPAQWFVAGTTVAEPTAVLEISITTGTNTPEQKARFVHDAHAELQRQLAPQGKLAQASYVIVREVPATDWGYGGRTQHARRLA